MCSDAKRGFRARLEELQDGISNAAFARKCKLNTQDIQRYRAGDATPNIDKLVRIASAFGVTTDWLLGLSSTKVCGTSEPVTKKVDALRNAAAQVCAHADQLNAATAVLRDLL